MLFDLQDVVSGREFVELIPWVTWFAASWGQLVFVVLGSDSSGSRGRGALCMTSVLPESMLIRCGNSTREMDNELLDRLTDLMDCFDRLCDEGKCDISSYCDSRRVFPQNWLRYRFSNAGLLEVAGVRFDVAEFCVAGGVAYGSSN